MGSISCRLSKHKQQGQTKCRIILQDLVLNRECKRNESNVKAIDIRVPGWTSPPQRESPTPWAGQKTHVVIVRCLNIISTKLKSVQLSMSYLLESIVRD